MKYIVWILCVWVLSLPLQAQSYNDVVEQAMDCVKKDSLVQAERLFRQALKMEPDNARNALLFSNLGTVQKRMGKTDEAIESYTLALNIIPYSTTMLLNRAALYLEKDLTQKAYLDYCNVIDLLPRIWKPVFFVPIFTCSVVNIKKHVWTTMWYWNRM